MKRLLLTLVLALLIFRVDAQALIDSLQQQLPLAKSVEARIDILNSLSHAYTQYSLNRSEELAREALALGQENDYQKGIATSFNILGIGATIQGRHTEGMDYFIKAVKIRDGLNDSRGVAHVYNNMSRLLIYQEDYDRAIDYSKKSLALLQKIDDPKAVANTYASLGEIYMNKHDYDQALQMFTKARDTSIAASLGDYEFWMEAKRITALNAQGRYDLALQTGLAIERSLPKYRDFFSSIGLLQTIGVIYSNVGDLEHATAYLHKARHMADSLSDANARIDARKKLSDMFRKFKVYDSAWYYNDAYSTLRGELFNAEKSKQLAALEHLYQSEKKDQLLAMREEKIRVLTMAVTIGGILLVAITVLVIVVFRLYRDKRKSLVEMKRLNNEIYEKHEEILAQTEELTQANAEVSRMNESLEMEVSERVAEIKLQNEKLIEYAYFNAHNVRGPLARILGLCALMSRESSLAEIKDYNSRLLFSAHELDSVVREINRKLSD
jgi:tetratricopeptide (TPR) repeat protein